jgi:hypothetical protein
VTDAQGLGVRARYTQSFFFANRTHSFNMTGSDGSGTLSAKRKPPSPPSPARVGQHWKAAVGRLICYVLGSAGLGECYFVSVGKAR